MLKRMEPDGESEGAYGEIDKVSNHAEEIHAQIGRIFIIKLMLGLWSGSPVVL